MEVTIRPKNFKISDDIEESIRKRLDRLGRHIESLSSAEVLLSQRPTRLNAQRFDYVAQLTLHTHNNNIIRAEVVNPELLTAVDQGMDHLSRQVERFRSRYERRKKGAAGLRHSPTIGDGVPSLTVDEEELVASIRKEGANTNAFGETVDEGEDGGTIVRTKRFTVKPMFPEDALEEMEMLGHNFYVFYNAQEERVNVLYRRNDGNYGLIQPEFG